MRKNNIKVYGDGIIYLNDIEVNNNKGVLSKEFIQVGMLFFNYSLIRELDKFKFNTELKSEIKIRVPSNPIINSNQAIELENEFYSIEHIDKNKDEMFIFLKTYEDELDKIVEIFKIKKSESVLQDDELISIFKTFSKVDNNKFTIQYLKELDLNHNINVLSNYILSYENINHKIKQSRNIEGKSKYLELECESYGN